MNKAIYFTLALAITLFSIGCMNQFGQGRGFGMGKTVADQAESKVATGQSQQDPEPATGTQDEADSDGQDANPDVHPAMMDPSLAQKTAPEKFLVKFETTKGDFVMEINREWAPNGVDRFFNLVDIGYFKDVVIFRAVPRFMFQFGIHGDPEVNKKWKDANIDDDKSAGISNLPGYICFAHAGTDTRSTQMFISLGNNSRLDRDFTPFGRVVEGMDVVKKINTEYGENASQVQPNFQAKGNKYILESFPRIDIIKSVTLVVE